MSKAYMMIGRFQPPTEAHWKMFRAMFHDALEIGARPFIFYTKTVDDKRNPLSPVFKWEALHEMAPGIHIEGVKDVCEALKLLSHWGWREVYILAGDDRLSKYADFKKYIGKDVPESKRIDLDAIHLRSAGPRDPDSDGLDGVSASKARHEAVMGDYVAFKRLLPQHFREELMEQLYNSVRKGLGCTELSTVPRTP